MTLFDMKKHTSVISAHMTQICFLLLLLIIFGFSYFSFVNFSTTSKSYIILKQSVNFQINILNNISKTLPQMSFDKKESYIYKEVNNLYKIQKKNEEDVLVNIITKISIEKNQYDKYNIKITMLPSSHTCLFIEKHKMLIGQINVTAINKKDFNCSKDVVLFTYTT